MVCLQLALALVCTLLAVWCGQQLGNRQAHRRRAHCPAASGATAGAAQVAVSSRIRRPCPRKEGHPISSRTSSSCGPAMEAEQPHLFVRTLRRDKSDSLLFMDDFKRLHHPNSAVPAELVLSREGAQSQHYAACQQVFVSRTGIVRYGKPNKCAAVVQLPAAATSAFFQSLRVGKSAGLLNMYQDDYMRSFLRDHMPEWQLLGSSVLSAREQAIQELLALVGPSAGPDGRPRSLVVLVANDGVMDFVLNFACSARAAGADTGSVVVFVGSAASVQLVQHMGLRAIFSPALGGMPQAAAGGYGDDSFAAMMWLKVTAVYVALAAGFEVLFQDTDIVWFRDPLPFLRTRPADALFMDDGARTIRFTPYFANSGFYYLRNNERTRQLMERMLKSAAELAQTHSHQSTLTRYLTEAQHLCNLDIEILSVEEFPSGDQYHNDKPYLRGIAAGTEHPFVFHMSFTASRQEKVKYFLDINMWRLAANGECGSAPGMRDYTTQPGYRQHPPLLEHCCLASV